MMPKHHGDSAVSYSIFKIGMLALGKQTTMHYIEGHLLALVLELPNNIFAAIPDELLYHIYQFTNPNFTPAAPFDRKIGMVAADGLYYSMYLPVDLRHTA